MVLKFLEKSFAYVFDKNDFNFDYEVPAKQDQGRPSNALNEDDYDYALELQEHDEYRTVAAKNCHISDFNDENIQQAVAISDKVQRKLPRKLSSKKGSAFSLSSLVSFESAKRGKYEEDDQLDDVEEVEEDSDDEENSDSDNEDEKRENKTISRGREFFKQFKQKSFTERMYKLNKRKRWVESHSRRYYCNNNL